MIPIDLELACSNYLLTRDGHKHWVMGLERMARLARAAGVRFYWDSWDAEDAGWCDRERRCCYLAPWLYECGPVRLKDVWVHELAHALFPWADELYCFRWARARFGDIIDLDYLRIA
jgi:hypothetical protein